ncbi:hypothetical protein HQ533_01425 [Candidatus Woesearchaeota archaeon]|nr:hypothetical protein [Candidatus Woesearchaeota archaeon]
MLRKKGTWTFMQGALMFVFIFLIASTIFARQYVDKTDDATSFSDCQNIPGIKNGTCVANVAECDTLNGYSYSPDSFGCPTKLEPDKKICCTIS